MAHHIFELNGHVLRMHDTDVALLKHFLERGRATLGNVKVLAALRHWQWVGPGVWINVDESILQSQEEVFHEAEKAVVSLGMSIPAKYIRNNVPDLEGVVDRQAAAVLTALHKLKAHIETSAYPVDRADAQKPASLSVDPTPR